MDREKEILSSQVLFIHRSFADKCCALKMLSVDMEQWHKLMGVNVDGVVLCYKYAAIQMVKQGEGGRIIGTYI